MLRYRWQFGYKAAQLQEASQAKMLHHSERQKFWEESQEKVMKEVRESGIEISESPAGASHSNTHRGPQVLVRNDLQERINECHAKRSASTRQKWLNTKAGCRSSHRVAWKISSSSTRMITFSSFPNKLWGV